jgi:iron complex outermembrane receptor protein
LNSNTFASFQYLRQVQSTGWNGFLSTVQDATGNVLNTGTIVFQDSGVLKRATLSPSLYLGGPLGSESNTFQGQLLHSLSPNSQLRVQGGVIDTPLSWYGTPGAAAVATGGPGTYTGQQFRGSYANVQWSLTAPRQTFTAGAETRADRAFSAVYQTTNYLAQGSGVPADSYSGGKAFNQGVYLQDQLRLSDALSVTLGGRYDYWSTYDGTNQASPAVPPNVDPTRSNSSLNGKLAAVYRLTPTTVVRSSVGNAFRNPSVYELYTDLRLASGSQYLANPNVNPERMTSWEAGVRQNVTRRGTVDAVYFENRINSLIYRITDLAADPTGKLHRLVNAGEGRTRGVELVATERPNTLVSLRQTYTFNDAIITSNPALPTTEGKDIPYVPRHVASASATVLRGPWSATALGQYESAVFTTDTNTDIVQNVPGGYSAFLTIDLSASYRVHPNTTLYVNCDDLTNRRYYMYFLTPGRLVFAGIRWHL